MFIVTLTTGTVYRYAHIVAAGNGGDGLDLCFTAMGVGQVWVNSADIESLTREPAQ